MPRVKTIRTIQQRVEREEDIRQEPKYAVGDYMEVYFGHLEGHNFYVRDIRYDHDTNSYEYLYGGLLGGWMLERQIVLLRKAKNDG